VKKQGLKADKDRNIDGCHFYKNRIALIIRSLSRQPIYGNIDKIHVSIDDIKEKSKAKFGHSKHFMYLCRQIKTKNNE
jgi:hypothetical protein